MTKHALDFFSVQVTGGGKEVVNVGNFSANFIGRTGSTNHVQTGELGKDSDLTSRADGIDNVAAADVASKGTNGDGLVTNNKGLFFRNGIVDADHGSTPDVVYCEDTKGYSFFFTPIMCI